MKKLISICIISFIFATNLIARDNIKVFDLIVPAIEIQVENSLYNNIEFVDDRPDWEYQYVRINSQNFRTQLKTIIDYTIDRSANNGSLLLQLRNLDIENISSKEAEALIRINLYEKENNNYYRIASLDSKILIENQQYFEELISNVISNFIIQNLKQEHIEPEPYSIDNIHNLTTLEKSEIPLYKNTSYKDGIYQFFKDFADQTPLDYKVTPKFKKNELKEIKISSKDEKPKKIEPKIIYAVVVGGQPYIATEKKYCPLYRDGDNFWFEDYESKSRFSVSPSFSVGIGSGGYRGGGIGIGVFTQSKKIRTTYFIDHLSGDFITIRQEE